ncbi:hypothetical protein EGW08_021439, partial [Elysia chlorotica]
RGNLPQWGPNHVIKAVISRFTPVSTSVSPTPSSSTLRDNPAQNMEILVLASPDGGKASLIGGPVRFGKSPYSTLCDIITEIFPDDEAHHDAYADQEDMIHTFSRFASHIHGKKSKAGFATYGYSAFLVYRGYEDNPLNTDNAWHETEIFNFHYKHRDNFNSCLKNNENVEWQAVSDRISLSPGDLAAVKDAEKLRTNSDPTAGLST